MAGALFTSKLSAADAITTQHKSCIALNAPCTARIMLAQLAILKFDNAVARRMSDWPELSQEDALPLRVAGGLHNLYLTGDAPELGDVYRGELTDQDAIDALAVGLAEKFDARLARWLDGPPQTNEAGRSAGIMTGLLWLSERLGPRFELNEIGASAGINTMMERYFFDLGGTRVGPEDSPMRLVPDWRGPPPPDVDIEITAIRGSDIAVLNLADTDEATRLKSFVWPDVTDRMQRIDAAIALAAQRKPDLVEADAGDWVPEMLAQPQERGVTRVLYHSIMWQYMPAATRKRISRAMDDWRRRSGRWRGYSLRRTLKALRMSRR